MEPVQFKAAFDAINRINAATTSDELHLTLQRDLASLGYEFLLFAMAPAPHRQTFDRLVLFQHWPSDWFDQYSRSNFHDHDPIAQFVRTRFDAFDWSDVPPSDDPISRTLMASSAADFGMRRGLCIPIHDCFGYRAALSLATSHEPPQSHAAAEMIAIFAFNRMNRLRLASTPTRLTTREREVVTWAAAGKTAWDTGSILHVSEQTIEKHLTSAMRKLNSYTKAQVVAESLRSGEISL